LRRSGDRGRSAARAILDVAVDNDIRRAAIQYEIATLRAPHLENVVLPRGHIQVQSARLQVGPVAIVPGLAKQVLKAPRPTAEVGEGEPDVTLALVGRVIHGDEQAVAAGALPGVGNEILA
jgi:hypothetical protein